MLYNVIGSVYRDYMVVSNFTWAFFEDSGWYRINYTYTNSIDQLEMKWGKSTKLILYRVFYFFVLVMYMGCGPHIFYYYTEL